MFPPLFTPSFFSVVKESGDDEEVNVDVNDDPKIINSSLKEFVVLNISFRS